MYDAMNNHNKGFSQIIWNVEPPYLEMLNLYSIQYISWNVEPLYFEMLNLYAIQYIIL